MLLYSFLILGFQEFFLNDNSNTLNKPIVLLDLFFKKTFTKFTLKLIFIELFLSFFPFL